MRVSSPTELTKPLPVVAGLSVRHCAVGLAAGAMSFRTVQALCGVLSMPTTIGVALGVAYLYSLLERGKPPGWLGHQVHRLTGGLWVSGALPCRKDFRVDGR